jgi:hypothetical protein
MLFDLLVIYSCQISQSLNTSSLVTLDPPSALSPRVLNALKADPRTVDLRALAPHFYDLGARILELFEEEEMIEVLGDVRQMHGQTTTRWLTSHRLSSPELRSLLIKHITLAALWVRAPTSCEV